jgi:hypothetical protein
VLQISFWKSEPYQNKLCFDWSFCWSLSTGASATRDGFKVWRSALFCQSSSQISQSSSGTWLLHHFKGRGRNSRRVSSGLIHGPHQLFVLVSVEDLSSTCHKPRHSEPHEWKKAHVEVLMGSFHQAFTREHLGGCFMAHTNFLYSWVWSIFQVNATKPRHSAPHEWKKAHVQVLIGSFHQAFTRDHLGGNLCTDKSVSHVHVLYFLFIYTVYKHMHIVLKCRLSI